MGKEQVYFKETREKAITKKDRLTDRASKFVPREKSKNISKKDMDKARRVRRHEKLERAG